MRIIQISEAELESSCVPPKSHMEAPHIALLRDYLSLTDAQLRQAEGSSSGLYIAESLKVLEVALSLGHRPRSILTSQRWLEALERLQLSYPTALEGCSTLLASAAQLKSLTGYHVHRGTLASIARPPLLSVESLARSGQTLVVLEDLVDHTNVGAICRSVVGLGAGGLILSPCCVDPLYRRSLKVSMGAALRAPWARSRSWATLAPSLKGAGYTLVALSLSARSQTLRSLASEPPERVALLLGSEGRGLSPEAHSYADHCAYIEMSNEVESLNVASAAALALWALSSRGPERLSPLEGP